MQIGLLASALNSHPQGSFSNDTKLNPKNDKNEYHKAITFRSGKKIESKHKESR